MLNLNSEVQGKRSCPRGGAETWRVKAEPLLRLEVIFLRAFASPREILFWG
jgi:hypothetical protein